MKNTLQQMEKEALAGGMDIDFAVYEEAGRDPCQPVFLGSGSLSARVGIFGRDPGRNEVLLGEPFIGKAGQLIRDGLHRAIHGTSCPNLEASIEVGRSIFWSNTVPYKPLGNKAWSVAVKRRFAPHVQQILVHAWSGHDLITCGNVAFEWFGLVDKTIKPVLQEFWRRADRYETSLEIECAGKALRLHPLPHPSPLNARWYPLFPGLLDQRLRQLDWKGA